MDGSETSAAFVAELAEEFLDRYRRGERPALKEYTDRYPQLAEEILEVFPALAMMENIALADDSPAGTRSVASRPVARPALQQLGDYRILREVGRGGMGVVYEAEQISLGRHVALKVLPDQMLRDSKQMLRFEREAKAAARLHHTNIVPVFGVGEHRGTPYYVMQFIPGLGLDDVIEEVKRLRSGPGAERPGRLPEAAGPPSLAVTAASLAHSLLTNDPQAVETGPVGMAKMGWENVPTGSIWESAPPSNSESQDAATDRLSDSSVPLLVQSSTGDRAARRDPKSHYWLGIAKVGVQVASALDYAHKQGILHRDIKPSNLLLDNRGAVWVTDFGLAKADDQQNLTHTGDVLGTLRYMPPEAFEGRYDARSDVYSLGLTLYELLALRPAFDENERGRLVRRVMDSEPPRLDTVRTEVPRDLQTIVHKAIDREPVHRYATAGALQADLQRYLDDEPILARRQTIPERYARWARRYPGIATLGAVLTAVLILGTAVSTFFAFRASDYAKQSDKSAKKARDEKRAADLARADAETARRKTEIRLADMHTAYGEMAGERGDAAQAMLWFANAARLGRDDPERLRANRARVRAWAREATLPVRVLTHDGQHLKQLAFRPGGDLLLTVTVQGRLTLWDWLAERPLDWTSRTPNVGTCAWSPDGSSLALAFPNGRVEIRAALSGEIMQSFQLNFEAHGFAYNPDGSRLAVAAATLRLWDCRDGGFVGAPRGHPQPLRGVTFNARGDRVATACDDGLARVYAVEPEGPSMLPLFPPIANPGFNGRIVTPAFVDDDRGLITATAYQEATWWDATTGKKLRTIPLRGTSMETAIVPSPDRMSCAINTWGEIQLVSASDGNGPGRSLMALGNNPAAAFSPDGQVVLSTSETARAQLWSVPDAKPIGGPLLHRHPVTGAAFASDGEFLATAENDGLVRVWRRAVGAPPARELVNDPVIYRAALVSPDGRYAVGTWYERFDWGVDARRVQVYDVETGELVGPPLELNGTARGMAFAPDSKTLYVLTVSDGADGFLHTWSFQEDHPPPAPKALPAPCRTLAVRPDGARVALVAPSGEVFVLDTDGMRERQRYQLGARGAMPVIAYTVDGRTLVIHGINPTDSVRVLDPETGQSRYPPLRSAEMAQVYDVALSGDGRWLATTCHGVHREGYLQVWDLETGKPASPRLAQPAWSWQACFSPDGRSVLSACSDGQAWLWDWSTGKQVCPPMVLPNSTRGGVSCVAFTPDGRWVVIGGHGCLAQVREPKRAKP